MKKTFIMATLIAVAAIFASCGEEPTAIELEDLNGKVSVAGFVTIRTWKEKDDALQENEQTPLKDQKVTILYGMADPTDTTATPALIYQEFSAQTNSEGYYTIEMPVAAGQQVDEIKAQVRVFLSKATVAYYEDADLDKHFVTTDAWYQAEKIIKKASSGLLYSADLVLTPVEMTSYPNLKVD